jgi:hypothetical protein
MLHNFLNAALICAVRRRMPHVRLRHRANQSNAKIVPLLFAVIRNGVSMSDIRQHGDEPAASAACGILLP